MKPPRSLGPQDQLTYMVGAVARVDVAVEAGLRLALRRLEAADADPHPKGMSALLKRARKALPGWTVRDELLTAAHNLLDEVEAAHDKRNRYVHDLLLKERGEYTQLDLFRIKEHTVEHVESLRTPFTIDDIAAVWTRLKRCEWRLRSLEQLIRIEQPNVAGWTFHVVTDRFEMSRTGGQITSSGYLYDDDDAMIDELDED